MGYSIKRVDKTQSAIVRRLRSLGCHVLPIHILGHGAPDLLVGIRRVISGNPSFLCLVEVKDGSKPPSKRKLTPDEAKFHRDWKGFVHIIGSVDEAQEFVERVWADGGI